MELVPLEGAAVEGDPLQLHEQEHVLGGSVPIVWALANGGKKRKHKRYEREKISHDDNLKNFL